jgi:O-antigen/teichoic acid export membrane protein
LYAGNKTGDSALTPFLILLAGFVANSVGYIPYVFLLARGRVRTILFVHLGEVLPYWLLAVDMIHRFGAVGAAASWASRALVDSALFLWLTHRDEHLDVGWLPVVRRPVWLIGGLLVATLWALDRVGEGIWLRVTLGSVAGTVAGWALLMWLLTEEERVIALERVRNIKSKFQKGGRERSA